MLLREKMCVACGLGPMLHDWQCSSVTEQTCMKPDRIWLLTSPRVPGLWFLQVDKQSTNGEPPRKR